MSPAEPLYSAIFVAARKLAPIPSLLKNKIFDKPLFTARFNCYRSQLALIELKRQ